MTRGVFLSRISVSSVLRISGEFARSMSPETSKIVALSMCRGVICTSLAPFCTFRCLHHVLRHSQVIRFTAPAVLDYVHALAHQVETQTTRLQFARRRGIELALRHGDATVRDFDFDSRFGVRWQACGI